MQPITQLSDLSEQYDAYLIDAWGVLHDGDQVFASAYDCLRLLKQQSKKVVILSNAARRTEDVNHELLRSEIDNHLYDFSLSSGELVWQNFEQGIYKKLGKYCYYLGPKRSIGILNGLDLAFVTSIEKADFILNTGAEGNHPNALEYKPLLQDSIEKKLPMICANPDLVAIRRGIHGISAGSIAKLYEDLGGKVQYTGKPYSQIYEVCYEKLSNIPKNRILMIGDGLQTDIKGANDFGIDSLFIKNGIYHQQITANTSGSNERETSILNELFHQEGAKPTYHTEILNY